MGNWRHFVIPSNNQPSISFCVSHHPSPCFSFFTKMGLSSWSSPGPGSGNTVYSMENYPYEVGKFFHYDCLGESNEFIHVDIQPCCEHALEMVASFLLPADTMI